MYLAIPCGSWLTNGRDDRGTGIVSSCGQDCAIREFMIGAIDGSCHRKPT